MTINAITTITVATIILRIMSDTLRIGLGSVNP